MLDFGLSPEAILVIATAFLLAGLVKGVVGGGLPAVAVPIMANVIAPAVAAAVTLMPVIVTNFWLLFQGGRFQEVMRRYWTFLVPLAGGSLIGAQILVTAPPATMALVIGSFSSLTSADRLGDMTQVWLDPGRDRALPVVRPSCSAGNRLFRALRIVKISLPRRWALSRSPAWDRYFLVLPPTRSSVSMSS